MLIPFSKTNNVQPRRELIKRKYILRRFYTAQFFCFRGLGLADGKEWRCMNLKMYELDPLKPAMPCFSAITIASFFMSLSFALAPCLVGWFRTNSFSSSSRSGQWGSARLFVFFSGHILRRSSFWRRKHRTEDSFMLKWRAACLLLFSSAYAIIFSLSVTVYDFRLRTLLESPSVSSLFDVDDFRASSGCSSSKKYSYSCTQGLVSSDASGSMRNCSSSLMMYISAGSWKLDSFFNSSSYVSFEVGFSFWCTLMHWCLNEKKDSSFSEQSSQMKASMRIYNRKIIGIFISRDYVCLTLSPVSSEYFSFNSSSRNIFVILLANTSQQIQDIESCFWKKI